MNKREAHKLGRSCSLAFVDAYQSLVLEGFIDHARAMILSTFPFALASIHPNYRTAAVAEVVDMYFLVGREVFEDSQDLYDTLTQANGYGHE